MYANLCVTYPANGTELTVYATQVDVDKDGRVTFVADESDSDIALEPGKTYTVPDGASVRVTADF
jgi:hypothetical protein